MSKEIGSGLKGVTIEDLAAMVQRGFKEMEKRFDAIGDRFDRIEKLILADHKRRIERLEEQVKDLRDSFGHQVEREPAAFNGGLMARQAVFCSWNRVI